MLGGCTTHAVTILKTKMDAPMCPWHYMSLWAPERLANFQARMAIALGKLS